MFLDIKIKKQKIRFRLRILLIYCQMLRMLVMKTMMRMQKQHLVIMRERIGFYHTIIDFFYRKSWWICFGSRFDDAVRKHWQRILKSNMKYYFVIICLYFFLKTTNNFERDIQQRWLDHKSTSLAE